MHALRACLRMQLPFRRCSALLDDVYGRRIKRSTTEEEDEDAEEKDTLYVALSSSLELQQAGRPAAASQSSLSLLTIVSGSIN
jgi:hypothetical protein